MKKPNLNAILFPIYIVVAVMVATAIICAVNYRGDAGHDTPSPDPVDGVTFPELLGPWDGVTLLESPNTVTIEDGWTGILYLDGWYGPIVVDGVTCNIGYRLGGGSREWRHKLQRARAGEGE